MTDTEAAAVLRRYLTDSDTDALRRKAEGDFIPSFLAAIERAIEVLTYWHNDKVMVGEQ